MCSDCGAMLVEVMVGTLILLVVFAGVVTQMSNLATTRVRIETRDRVVAYTNSLQEKMSSAGCGLDVDTVEETVFVDSNGNNITASSDKFSGSNQVALKGAWDRVSTCAFSSLETALNSSTRKYSYVDGGGNLRLTANENGDASSAKITKQIAQEFCNLYGQDDNLYTGKVCELGDQSYVHKIYVNEDSSYVNIDVKVNYWFEILGSLDGTVTTQISRKTSCADIISSKRLPDTLVRRVEVTFPDGKGNKESFVLIKRENVPVDSFQFSSGTRVGLVSTSGSKVSMYPNLSTSEPFKVTRERYEQNSCIWFPYIDRHEVSQKQPSFSIDSAGSVQATLTNIDVLSSGSL
ncbi:MAG: hypothetical protein U0R17_01160 [Acidimicrobiia bacterium]